MLRPDFALIRALVADQVADARTPTDCDAYAARCAKRALALYRVRHVVRLDAYGWPREVWGRSD